jgi:hypothetical protein
MKRSAGFCSWKAMRVRVVALCVTCLVALAVWITPALGTTVNYWGYNNLTANNPPAGTCPGAISGLACSGWSNWDYSQVDWTSGRSAFAFGFICGYDGILWARPMSGQEAFQTYTVHWYDYCPTHYNRAAVNHRPNGEGTYNYLQGRGLIF